MKRKVSLIALFLVLSFVVSSYAAPTQPDQIRKVLMNDDRSTP
ncbi:uncharacterized protein LOC108871171 [Brassica rapa]|nr:uncharacterized protein LOC108871171 [Brassica rapa]